MGVWSRRRDGGQLLRTRSLNSPNYDDSFVGWAERSEAHADCGANAKDVGTALAPLPTLRLPGHAVAVRD
jgi:hypothetical protein